MNWLNNFHFIRPYGLLLVAAVIFVWWFVKKRNDPMRAVRGVIEPELLDAMTTNKPELQTRSDIVWLVTWVVAAIAIAGPTWKPEPSPFADDPVPVMVLLKASESMQQTDLVPDRMERARLKVVDFVEQRKGQPVGLIAWSASSHLVLPPTRDTSVVGTMATEVGPSIMPKAGDDLPMALQLADKTLGEDGGSILVVADTITQGSEEQLAQFKSRNRIRIEILGIAREGTPEESDLKQAASALGAQLTLMTSDDKDVSQIARRVGEAPVGVAATGETTRWAEMGWWLVPIVALLSLAGFRREETVEESIA